MQELPCSPKEPSSYYEEVIDSIEKWLNKNDPSRKEIEGNQINDDPTTLIEQGLENKEEHVTKIVDISNFSDERYPNQIESCTPIASTSTSHPTIYQ